MCKQAEKPGDSDLGEKPAERQSDGEQGRDPGKRRREQALAVTLCSPSALQLITLSSLRRLTDRGGGSRPREPDEPSGKSTRGLG